ncbi:hypothetical protein FGG08_004657 [Glutinoglossum americanum]|uniref:Myb-like domain-containing protein n=1 Tax=Glutinoglossum americanum TaxID=1670608 RepID=A0A9P8L3Q2_9PEZI|nr:hypothetical protein FGG08_004657 [Glutinoglossum americanum]
MAADIGLSSGDSWHQPPASQSQKRTLPSNEKQWDNLARIGRFLYDYRQEDVEPESSQWALEPQYHGLPTPDMPLQAGGHDVKLRSQPCCLRHFSHTGTAPERAKSSIGDEISNVCDSKSGAHSTDDIGQDVWETSSSREYSWSSPLTMPYSIFGEAISQCCDSSSHGSNNGWWDQRQVDEAGSQSVETTPLSKLNGLDFPLFCGNWVDDSVVIGQHYGDHAGTSAISPGSPEEFQNPPVGCLGLPEDSLYTNPVCIGEVASENDEKVSSFLGQHRTTDGTSSQLTNPDQKAVFASPEPCSVSRFSIRPKIDGTQHDTSCVSPCLDSQMTSCTKTEVRYQQKRPLKQASVRTSVPKLIRPKLPSGERNWRSSSLGSRTAPTRRSPQRSRMNPDSRTAQRKTMKDQFLIESKLAGMSYKEIREKGNFSEAESTLRGRFRTLTKEKGQRVRKPEWEEKDIRLLQRAVEDLTATSSRVQALSSQTSRNVKIPWKQVAEYVAKHGGSYHFGNATCRKKWDETKNRGLRDDPHGKSKDEEG